jgi:hypothetical protein
VKFSNCPPQVRFDDLEAAVAFEHETGCSAADRNADHVLHRGEAQAMTRDLGLVDPDFQDRHPGHILDLDLAGAANAFQDRSDLVGGAPHRLEPPNFAAALRGLGAGAKACDAVKLFGCSQICLRRQRR